MIRRSVRYARIHRVALMIAGQLLYPDGFSRPVIGRFGFDADETGEWGRYANPDCHCLDTISQLDHTPEMSICILMRHLE